MRRCYNALACNVDLKIVADKGSNAPGYGFVALIARTELVESGQLRDYVDLKGRPVAILSRASGAEAQLEKALAQANLTTADVNLTTMQLPDMATALANKSIDVALSLEPLITAGVEQGLFVRWKGVDEFYPNDQTALIVYSPEFGGKAEAARRWMLAYVKGLRDYNDAFGKGLNKDAVIAVINQYTTVKDPNIARKMVPAALNPDGWVNLDDLLYKQSAYIRYGAMREPADLPRAVDHQYVEFALQQLGAYR
jgi:ABC-type nitrate/sulfonate/bicarbonate transport system substrate-binding protein